MSAGLLELAAAGDAVLPAWLHEWLQPAQVALQLDGQRHGLPPRLLLYDDEVQRPARAAALLKPLTPAGLPGWSADEHCCSVC